MKSDKQKTLPMKRSNEHDNFIVYEDSNGIPRIDVRMEEGTVWLSQQQMADLFQTTKQNIGLHLKNIFSDGELESNSVVKDFFTTAVDGKQYYVRFYNLDAIISVGYRVKSTIATRFRIWATQRLREYLIKGFTLDDERLKGNDRFAEYFDELLARIRDIRASEARAYQRVREIFALASDYVEGDKDAQLFFANMQNKMHYAATGHTAAELIKFRADCDKPNMGLMTWKGSQVLKGDVGTAKNYLDEKEIDILNRIVVMFLDQAEFRVLRKQNILTHDWEVLLDKFLNDNELPVLMSLGSVSHEKALKYAHNQYDKYEKKRRLVKEKEADEKYLDDLQQTAKLLSTKRVKK